MIKQYLPLKEKIITHKPSYKVIWIVKERTIEYDVKALAKAKVDLYLDLVENRGYLPHLLEIDRIITFFSKRERVSIKADIAYYTEEFAIKSVFFIVSESTNINTLIKYAYKAIKIENISSLKNIVVYNTDSKEYKNIEYFKYKSYKDWIDNKCPYLSQIPMP